MSAIVVFNKEIAVTKIEQLCNQWVTCVELGTSSGRCIVANLYFQFRHPIEPYLDQLEIICRTYAGVPLIITADANAKSPMWHSHRVIGRDRRGRALEEFIYGHGLEVANQPNNPPTYQGRAGASSNIDVTLCNAESMDMVEGWRVVDNVTVSDHNLIVFEFVAGRLVDGNGEGKRRRYNMSKANWEKLRAELILPSPVAQGDNVNMKAKQLTWALQDAMRKSIPVVKGDTKVGNKPWNDRLQSLRARARRTRRRYQRCRDPAGRVVLLNIYRESKREFEDGLYQEKRKSWEKYVQEELQRGPWGVPFKIASGKLRPPAMITTLSKDDGSTTTSWEESAVLLMETLLPDDDVTEDTEEHQMLRERMENDETYHQMILLSIVSYGACIWAHRLTNVAPAKAIQGLQRNILLRLTGAYRTVATDALSVALGVWPLDLLIRKKAVAYWLKKRNLEKVRLLTTHDVRTFGEAEIVLLEEWQRRWERSGTGRRTYQLFPNVVERLENKHLQPSRGLVHFITGKGPYPASLRKLGLIESGNCQCGEEGTPEHVVLECVITLEARRNYQREIQGRLVGEVLRDPIYWKFLDQIALEASDRAKTAYIDRLKEAQGRIRRDVDTDNDEEDDSDTEGGTDTDTSAVSAGTTSLGGSESVRMTPSSHVSEPRAPFSIAVTRNDSPLYSSIVAPRNNTQYTSSNVNSATTSTTTITTTTTTTTAAHEMTGSGLDSSTQLTLVHKPAPFYNTSAGWIGDDIDPTVNLSNAARQHELLHTAPFHNIATGMGPIGSKIPVTNVWESYTDTGLQTSSHYLPAETRTSHFLTSLTDPMSSMQINKPIPVSPPPYGFDNVWEKQNPTTAVDSKICAQETRQKLFSESWPESLWDPLYTPAAVYPQPATASVWGNFVNSVCSPHSVTPPAPEHDKENTAIMDQSDGFNPFHSLNNIWSPLPSETWGTLATGKNE
uniref:Endonuclease/exonuclease/phosphatase domain-containing protein n=1 Tax=Timema monikensis TaxID=170555 RepID=A0A7R9HMG5_9NEOP|nr:unnamed protein product [Timema monikensis]